MSHTKTALVLGGGGLYGAYQAGVWQELESVFRPDLVVGASIGALNGWAIAGGCPAADRVREWLSMGETGLPGWVWPRNPLGGIVNRSAFEQLVRSHYERWKPRTAFRVTITELRTLRPFAVDWPAVDWRHLCASCAVPLILPQYKLEGRFCTDGGLTGSVPVWAAVEAGARRIVAVNILPGGGPPALRAAKRLLRFAGPPGPSLPASVELVVIEHHKPLGRLIDMGRWKRENVERWIELGRREALAALPRIRAWKS